jgi:uncharacterized phage infection (PIP) family protein YhgE
MAFGNNQMMNYGTAPGQNNSGSGAGLGSYIKSGYKKLTGIADESQSAKNLRDDLNETGQAANQFAEYNQGGVQALDVESQALRDAMRRRASGQDSFSSEQLRQGLQQNLNAQRSAAASASPQNAAMASRAAMNNMNRAGIGMSGQAAMAGIQERAAAEQALARMMMEQRGQSMQGAIGSRGNAISGYGGVKPEGSTLDKWGGAVSAGLQYYANKNKPQGGK